MFGSNTRTGKNFFETSQHYQEGKLMVTSLFYTLQGEGRYSGQPAVFIRLTKCHLACSFCLPASITVDLADNKKKNLSQVHKGDMIQDFDSEGNVTYTQVLSATGLLVPITELKHLVFQSSKGVQHAILAHQDHQFGTVTGKFVSVTQLEAGEYAHSDKVNTRWGEVSFISSKPISQEELRKLRHTEKTQGLKYLHSNPDKVLITAIKTESATYIARGFHNHNCDTFFDEGDWMSVEYIMKKVASLHEGKCGGKRPIIVITGGEPMLQASNLIPLISKLQYWNYTVTLETTGTYAPLLGNDLDQARCIHYTVSPKIVKKEHLRIHKSWAEHRNWDFKFVVGEGDPLYTGVPEFVKDYPDTQVYVSPMNKYKWVEERILVLDKKFKGEVDGPVLSQWDKDGPLDLEANMRNHQYAAQLCLTHGYRLSLQTHLFTALP